MENVIVTQASDHKFTDFFRSFQTYVPTKLYNEDWYVELKKISNTITKNKLEEKFDFTDRRIVLIAYKSLEKVETPGTKEEWMILRSYVELYFGKKDVGYSDLRDYIDMYIGYHFTSAEMNENAEKKMNKLKDNLSELIRNGELSLPLFVKNSIIGKVEMSTTPDIEFAPEPPAEEIDVEQNKKHIENKKKFAKLMLSKSKTDEEREEWQNVVDMLNLLES